MESIYYGVAIVFYGIFIIRFILNWMEEDFEINSNLDINDIVHFIMGLSGWLSIKSLMSTVQWYDYITAIVIGCLFVVALFYVYRLILKLENDKKKEELLNQENKNPQFERME